MLEGEFSSSGISVDEGKVDVELNLADVDELSLWPPLDLELFVPPLPLQSHQHNELLFAV